MSTPWKWSKGDGNTSSELCDILARDNSLICCLADEEDAERIVRAVNSHAELLGVCRMILRWCKMENSDDQEIEDLTLQTVAEHAEAAIAKAEGRNQ